MDLLTLHEMEIAKAHPKPMPLDTLDDSFLMFLVVLSFLMFLVVLSFPVMWAFVARKFARLARRAPRFVYAQHPITSAAKNRAMPITTANWMIAAGSSSGSMGVTFSS